MSSRANAGNDTGMASKKNPKMGKAPAKPKAIEADYRKSLLRIVAGCRAPILRALKRFEIEQAKRTDSKRHDANVTAVRRSLAGVKAEFDTVVKKAKPGLLAQGVGRRTTAFAVDATDKSIRGVVKIPATETVEAVQLKGFIADNVALIKSIPAQLLDQVAEEMDEAWRIGRDTATTAKRIQERFGVSENRARLIARDQVASINGRVAAQRQKDLGITKFMWSTSLDERVRGDPAGRYPKAMPSHYAREGVVYDYSDPPDGELPGQPINCRCTAIAILPDENE